MTGYIILGGLCVLLFAFLVAQDGKNDKLLDENGRLKGRLETLQEGKELKSTPVTGPVTEDTIKEAIRYNGFVPDENENFIFFRVSGDQYTIPKEDLPKIYIIQYHVDDKADWDMDLLQHAAHLMSDELMMVKVLLDEYEGDDTKFGFRSFVAALDRNYESFRDNLVSYTQMIDSGFSRMMEIYNRMVEDSKDASVSPVPLTPDSKQNNKIVS